MSSRTPNSPGEDEDKDFDNFGEFEDDVPLHSYVDPPRNHTDEDDEEDSFEKAMQISVCLTDIGRFCTDEVVDQDLYLTIENEDNQVILAGTSIDDVHTLLESYSADTLSDIEVRPATQIEVECHQRKTAHSVHSALHRPAVNMEARLDGPMNELSDEDWEERQRDIGIKYIGRISHSISLNDDCLEKLELENRELMDDDPELVDFHSPVDLQKVLQVLSERDGVILESPILSVFQYLNANDDTDTRFATRLAFPTLRGPCDETLAAEILKFLIKCGQSPALMVKGLFYLAANKDPETRQRCKSIFVAFLCKPENRQLDEELTATCISVLAEMDVKMSFSD